MLFLKDRFSASGPNWVQIGKKDSHLIGQLSDLVNAEYAQIIGEIREIYKVVGLELNSSNFLIDGTKNNIILKVLGNDEFNLFKSQELIYQKIQDEGLPIPQIINSSNNNLYFQKPYLAIEYLSGKYFSGSNEDLILTSQAVNTLHRGLEKLDLSCFDEIETYQENSTVIIDALSEYQKDWKLIFGDRLSLLLEENLELIYATDAICKENLSRIFEAPSSVFHIDLHPHNLLLTANDARIIDIDSLKISRWPTAIGFCFYKLSRQAISFQGIKSIDLNEIKNFSASLSEHINFSGNKSNLLLIGAMTEVMRRLLIILEQNLTNGTSEWNNVLEIQINAISEINYFLKVL
jgi:hypothetical protein